MALLLEKVRYCACIVGCTILHSAFIIGDADVGFRRAKGLRNATNSAGLDALIRQKNLRPNEM